MRRFFRWVANQIFPHWHYRYPLFHRVLDVWFVILLCPIFVVVQSFIVLRHLTESLFLVWFQCKPGPYELQQLEAVFLESRLRLSPVEYCQFVISFPPSPRYSIDPTMESCRMIASGLRLPSPVPQIGALPT